MIRWQREDDRIILPSKVNGGEAKYGQKRQKKSSKSEISGQKIKLRTVRKFTKGKFRGVHVFSGRGYG